MKVKKVMTAKKKFNYKVLLINLFDINSISCKVLHN